MKYITHRLLILFFLLQINSFAQSIQKKYTQTDGLSSYNVRSVIKDLNGFLWVCTQDGLSKFDGVSFINYSNSTPNKNYRIDFSDCRRLFLDSAKGRLWVMGTEVGFNVIDCTTGIIVERYLNDFKATDSWLITCKKVENNVWIGSNNGLWVFSLQTHIYKKIALNNRNAGQRINSISVDQFGHILAFVNGTGLIVIDAKSKQIIAKEDLSFFFKTKENAEFLSSEIIADKLFIGTNRGLLCYTINSLGKLTELPFPTQNLFNNHPVKSINLIGDNIYITSDIFISLNKDFSKINSLSQNITDTWLSEINAVCSIDENLLALGCNAGLAIFDKSAKAIVATVNDEKYYSNKLKHVFALHPLQNNTTLSATQNGLFEINGSSSLKTIVPNGLFQNVSIVNKNEFIISNPDGIKLYKQNKLAQIEKVYPEFLDFQKWEINSCLQYNDSLFALGTENDKGILIWNKAKHLIFNINTATPFTTLKSNTVNSIYLDSKKKLWVLSDFSISIIDLNNKTSVHLESPLSKTKQSVGLFFDMVETNNQYWVASYGVGVLIFDKNLKLKNTITQNEGLCNNGVYKIFKTGNSVFVSSNNGISKIDAGTLKIKNLFYPNDGLHGNSFEEACGAQVDGKIYFGGLDGFTMIDPTKMRNNIIPPRLFFEEINIETASRKIDTINLSIENLQIPNNVTQTKISFIGLNYQNSNRVNYWYRITETGTNWINLKNQNFIQLIGISPGKYHLEVKAANEDGVECTPIYMELHFLPKWYQTLLFKILVALLIAALLYILYRFRIRQLKKVLTVRQKISQNLHDDIGSTLSAINMYTQVAKLQPQANDFIDSIEENTQDALGKLDDIIWSTNPKNDKIKNLVERMDGFARPLLQAKNITFQFTHTNTIDEQKIGEATRQNLFIIFKEAINNVAKYAECKNCIVVLEEKNKNIYCSITDDGKGFDVTKSTERNGILNMQLRAKDLKGNCTIESILGKGTKVMVHLPV